MKRQRLFSGEIRKQYFKMSPAEFFIHATCKGYYFILNHRDQSDGTASTSVSHVVRRVVQWIRHTGTSAVHVG